MAQQSLIPTLLMDADVVARRFRFARTHGPAWHFGASKESPYVPKAYDAPNDAPVGASPKPIAARERRFSRENSNRIGLCLHYSLRDGTSDPPVARSV
jgi:hypothetical protein